MLKIADFGISRIYIKETFQRQTKTTTIAATPSYEASEVELSDTKAFPRLRKYDIWSLGCKLLEFIVFVSSLWVDGKTSRPSPRSKWRVTQRGKNSTSKQMTPGLEFVLE